MWDFEGGKEARQSHDFLVLRSSDTTYEVTPFDFVPTFEVCGLERRLLGERGVFILDVEILT